MRFSERQDIVKKTYDIQVDSMSVALRNSLWNCILVDVFSEIGDYITTDKINAAFLRNSLWFEFYKLPIDESPSSSENIQHEVKHRFMSFEWYEVYDLIEYMLGNFGKFVDIEKFTKDVNIILERELSGYRVVSGIVAPIISAQEIMEVNNALNNPLNNVVTHLETALELLSDKEKPDYRNSIKESISAVESICKKIADNNETTLGDALKIIQKSGKIEFHGALMTGFKNIYGYTNQADGIRHAMMEEASIGQEDARYMLVSCSAFVNYLIEKCNKAGIKL